MKKIILFILCQALLMTCFTMTSSASGGANQSLNGTYDYAKKTTSQAVSLYNDMREQYTPPAGSGPGAKPVTQVVEVIPAGELITVYRVENGWAYISYKHNYGYIKTCYIAGWNTQDNYPVGETSWYNGYDWSGVYDYEYYKKNNPDVVAALGESPEACISHFVSCGMTEGRRASEAFQLDTYKEQHPELAGAYGNNNAAYYKHACGIPQ